MRWPGFSLVIIYFLCVYMVLLHSLVLCDLCPFFLLMMFLLVPWKLVIGRQCWGWSLCDELITRPEEWWRGLGDTQRQTSELISGHCLGTKARFLSFNRTLSRAFTGLLTGHNTVRRHLHLIGLSDSPLCRRCGAQEETSAHIPCECEALASLRYVYPGSFFLDPEDMKSISLGAIWNFSKGTGLT